MDKSTLKVQVSSLILSALLTVPTLAAAQENEPMMGAAPQDSQQDNMNNNMGTGNKGMMNDHMGMDHEKMMHNKMGGMKNKDTGNTQPKASAPNSNSNTSMPMQNDM